MLGLSLSIIDAGARAGGPSGPPGSRALAPVPVADGEGTIISPGNGVAITPLVTAAGTAERVIPGAGTVIGPSPTASGEATNAITSTGAANSPVPTAAGTGLRTITADGAPDIPIATASGAVQLSRDSAGAADAPMPVPSALGERVLIGSGAATVAATTASGSGDVTSGATIARVGFDSAALVSGLSETGTGTRLGILIGLNNSEAIPTIDTAEGWTILGSGLAADGCGVVAGHQTASAFDFGTSTGASRWYFYEYTGAAVNNHAYDTDATGQNNITVPALASFPTNGWAIQSTLFKFSAPAVPDCIHTSITSLSSAEGPPGRMSGDSNGTLGSFSQEVKDMGSNVGGACTVVIALEPA